MRTTIRMNDRILREAKITAAKEGLSLTAFIEKAVEDKLYGNPPVENGRSGFELVTFKGGGLCPGVDLDDTSSLLDVMEE